MWTQELQFSVSYLRNCVFVLAA